MERRGRERGKERGMREMGRRETKDHSTDQDRFERNLSCSEEPLLQFRTKQPRNMRQGQNGNEDNSMGMRVVV